VAISRHEEALGLADELLADIELSRIPPIDAARKTSRLARLLDDTEALRWLHYEINGYPKVGPLDAEAWAAATRSNRLDAPTEDGKSQAFTASLGRLHTEMESALEQLSAPSTTASGEWAPTVEREKRSALRQLRMAAADRKGRIDAIVGAFYQYVSERYQELRFGRAVETAFEVVREEVDSAIGALVPDALPKLNAAFENASSDNPEQWANAAGGCRRLIKAAADALQPPGPDIDGHVMDEDHYVNRLVGWVHDKASSDTTANLIEADLLYLDRRLEAVTKAGHKGAHADVGRFEASRYVTGTYLVLGDILRLEKESGH
jgi:AbiTii